MPSLTALTLFAGAAFLLAIMPGPGLFYVVGRTLAGGRKVGIASVLGTGLGGMVHVLAGAVGISAIVMTSAAAFTVLKVIGGVYLIYLGYVTWRSAGSESQIPGTASRAGAMRVLRQGFVVEAMNPKTALFFLAVIPQFVDPARGSIASQFIVLGSVSVVINMLNASVAVYGADILRRAVATRQHVIRRVQKASGAVLALLGVSLLFARRSTV